MCVLACQASQLQTACDHDFRSHASKNPSKIWSGSPGRLPPRWERGRCSPQAVPSNSRMRHLLRPPCLCFFTNAIFVHNHSLLHILESQFARGQMSKNPAAPKHPADPAGSKVPNTGIAKGSHPALESNMFEYSRSLPVHRSGVFSHAITPLQLRCSFFLLCHNPLFSHSMFRHLTVLFQQYAAGPRLRCFI
jgi:hypothetical protein